MKTRTFAQNLILGLLLLSGLSAQAQISESKNLTARDVKKMMRETQKSCPKLDCSGSRLQVSELSENELAELGTDTQAQLAKIARGMALDLWPDTILEGPFHSVFRVRMEKIEKLTLDGRALGYRLSFSDKAWNTDHCVGTPKPAFPSSSAGVNYRGCETGRIHDAGFVMNNFKTTLRDFGQNPEYTADAKNPVGLLSMTQALPTYPSIVIPSEGISCDRTSLQNKLVEKISLVEDYLAEQRGLMVCDEGERSDCFEESSLVTLLTSLEVEADHASLKRDAAAAMQIDASALKQPSLVFEKPATPSSSSSLLGSAKGPHLASAAYVTDSGYALCNNNPDCEIRFRIACDASLIRIHER